MTLVWAVVAASGLLLAAVSSRWAVDHATAAAAGLGASPFLVGLVLVAFGTDLPEVANSIVASLSGEGDVNVGNAIGSTAAQSTLVVGLLPWFAGRFRADRTQALVLGSAVVVAVTLGVVFVADGHLGRFDGAALLVAWVVLVALVRRRVPPPAQAALPLAERRVGRHVALAILGLLGVGAGATTAVTGLIQVAEALAVPAYLVSFLGLALGTSLPELLVDVTAVRRGQSALALGDAFGSSLMDATLALGIGPLIAPTAVTASLAVRGGLLTVGLMILATTVVAVRRGVGRISGSLLVVAYLASAAVLLG